MYNNEIKIRYINDKENELKYGAEFLNNIFQKIEPYEEKYNKDVAEFSRDEILNYYKDKHASSIYILQTLNSNFKVYYEWYKKNINRNISNSYDTIKADDLRQCIDKTLLTNRIVTRDTLIEWCNELPNAREKVIILGLFEGIKGRAYTELTHITIKDIHKNGKDIIVNLCTGRELKISHLLYNFMLEAQHEEYNYSLSGKTGKYNPYYDLGYIIKYNHNASLTKDDNFKMGQSVKRCLYRALDYLGVLDIMDSKAIIESGKIEMAKQIAKEGGIDLQKAIENKNMHIINNIAKEVGIIFDSKVLAKTIVVDYKDYF